jgi:hypothetical protein
MPVPRGELTPQQLCEHIRRWAEVQGYEYAIRAHASEFGLITLRDPDGWYTTTTVPKAHHGRRLQKKQFRYPVKELNNGWRS